MISIYLMLCTPMDELAVALAHPFDYRRLLKLQCGVELDTVACW
jgi:hypothetical protein